MIIYDYISKNCKEKIPDLLKSALRHSFVPAGLEEDAKQDIFLAWLSNNINVKNHKHSEIMSYALVCAKNAAAVTVRDLSTPIKVPKKGYWSKYLKENPYNYIATPLEEITEYHCDSDLNFAKEERSSDSEEDESSSVLTLLALGESLETIAEMKNRTTRWVRMQCEKESDATNA